MVVEAEGLVVVLGLEVVDAGVAGVAGPMVVLVGSGSTVVTSLETVVSGATVEVTSVGSNEFYSYCRLTRWVSVIS